MKQILNPIVNDGKSTVDCIRYYEVYFVHDTPHLQMAIFVYENKIYLYIIQYDWGKLEKTTLIEFGDCEPMNMEKAKEALKNHI